MSPLIYYNHMWWKLFCPTWYSHAYGKHTWLPNSTVTSHEWQPCLFTTSCRQTAKDTKSSVSFHLCKGIHRWSVDSPHKRLVMNEIFKVITSLCSTLTASVQFSTKHNYYKSNYPFRITLVSSQTFSAWKSLMFGSICWDVSVTYLYKWPCIFNLFVQQGCFDWKA